MAGGYPVFACGRAACCMSSPTISKVTRIYAVTGEFGKQLRCPTQFLDEDFEKSRSSLLSSGH